jgi:hypothetical protein
MFFLCIFEQHPPHNKQGWEVENFYYLSTDEMYSTIANMDVNDFCNCLWRIDRSNPLKVRILWMNV